MNSKNRTSKGLSQRLWARGVAMRRSEVQRSAIRRAGVRRRLVVERLTDRRVLAAVTGEIFNDANLSFHRDVDEGGLAGRLVYIDSNVNGQIDFAEPFTLSNDSGEFEFDELADGPHAVRVYQGSGSQLLTFPASVSVALDAVAVGSEDGPLEMVDVQLNDRGATILEPDGITLVDAVSGVSQRIALSLSNASAFESLPDGRLLVVGTAESGTAETGPSAWLVDPVTAEAQGALVDDASEPAEAAVVTDWADLALGSNGRGILLSDAGADSAVWSLTITDAASQEAGESEFTITRSATTVPAGSSVLGSGSRGVLASPTDQGLTLSLWSLQNEAPITVDGVEIDDVSELLAFDDSTGFLVLRDSGGGVRVLDGNNDFAALFDFAAASGPIQLDAARGVLSVANAVTSTVDRYDLDSGALIAQSDVDFDSVGAPVAVALNPQTGGLALAGTRGIQRQTFAPAAAAVVEVIDGVATSPVAFGFHLQGENTRPDFSSQPAFELNQDSTLVAPAPGILRDAVDADENDTLVVLQTGGPSSGVGVVAPDDGRLNYSPAAGFFGNDSIEILLHDGRDFAEATISLSVAQVVPDDVTLDAQDIPEMIEVGEPVGVFEFFNPAFENAEVFVNDRRFAVADGELIYVGGGINFEGESRIPISIDFYDSETDEAFTVETVLRVGDENDPVEAVFVTPGSVVENSRGAPVGLVHVIDEDSDQEFTYEVDDDRFEVVDDVLRLRLDQSLDFEAEQTVTVRLTASDGQTSASTDVEVLVDDVPEAAVTIDLGNREVDELDPGATVGAIGINGYDSTIGYQLTVNDPRFEIVDGVLGLADGVWVERAMADEIEIIVTAVDNAEEFAPAEATFVIAVNENSTPFHNDASPYDVNGDGYAAPFDALLIVNYLNIYGPGPVGEGDPGFGYDVNNDGFVTPLDVLLVVNELSRINQPLTGGEPEQVEENRPAEPIGIPVSRRESDASSDGTGRSYLSNPPSVLAESTPGPVTAPETDPRLDLGSLEWASNDQVADESADRGEITDQALRLLETPLDRSSV